MLEGMIRKHPDTAFKDTQYELNVLCWQRLTSERTLHMDKLTNQLTHIQLTLKGESKIQHVRNRLQYM